MGKWELFEMGFRMGFGQQMSENGKVPSAREFYTLEELEEVCLEQDGKHEKKTYKVKISFSELLTDNARESMKDFFRCCLDELFEANPKEVTEYHVEDEYILACFRSKDDADMFCYNFSK